MLDIYIDGDACPVKEETLRVAERYHLYVSIVSNQGMRPARNSNVKYIVVGAEFDAADNWIAEHALAGDIVITADIQLAARCLHKAAKVLGPTGQIFSTENIGSALAMRELNTYLREAGEIKGNNKSFSGKDRSQFLQSLDGLIQKLLRQSQQQ